MERVVIMLCLIFILHPISGVYANDEGDALMAFKAKLSDPGGYLKSWDPSLVNPCIWFHITCEEESVTRIDLSDLRLSGQLVPELGRLKNLKYLILDHNNLNGPIPLELGDLSSLQTMDMSKNTLTGRLPDSFGKLSNLKILRLSYNKLSGCIPFGAWKSIIPHLQLVDVSNNPDLKDCSEGL